MTPRLMVVCLGGLAGGGALVCCDLNEGVEAADETEIVDARTDDLDTQAADADASAAH